MFPLPCAISKYIFLLILRPQMQTRNAPLVTIFQVTPRDLISRSKPTGLELPANGAAGACRLTTQQPPDHKHPRQPFAFTRSVRKREAPSPTMPNPFLGGVAVRENESLFTADKPRYTPISHINDNGLLV